MRLRKEPDPIIKNKISSIETISTYYLVILYRFIKRISVFNTRRTNNYLLASFLMRFSGTFRELLYFWNWLILKLPERCFLELNQYSSYLSIKKRPLWMLVMVNDLLFQVPSSGLEPETSPLPREANSFKNRCYD